MGTLGCLDFIVHALGDPNVNTTCKLGGHVSWRSPGPWSGSPQEQHRGLLPWSGVTSDESLALLLFSAGAEAAARVPVLNFSTFRGTDPPHICPRTALGTRMFVPN